ncbi:MAG: protein-L-isoaspartate(D-aspartate) O-methyltransferase [Gemmatimonadales bacterium]|nr:protein-L-isoaspartate(D-aspartate) O-methyltransferase [Gemmatimonadales bacterium]
MKDFAVARRRMVAEQLAGAGLTDQRVLSAMEEVPRHRFVPRQLHHRAHQPSALPIGFGQTISKPFTVGLMTTLLELKGHEHVLEVGTGSGYQGAVLSRLAGTVLSVERVQPLAMRAKNTLAELGYDNITVLAHDGICGVADHAPFDSIIVTACAPQLPPHLVSQLKDGGYLLIPVDKGREQILYRYRRQKEEVVIEQSVSCRFVPLLGGVETGATPDQLEGPVASVPTDGEQFA